jgi:hypothetical protein
MAFTGNFMCTSFKQEVLQGIHNFTTSTGDVFKLALYTNSASFTAATTAYTATNEVANSGSYAAGGGSLRKTLPQQLRAQQHLLTLMIWRLLRQQSLLVAL